MIAQGHSSILAFFNNAKQLYQNICYSNKAIIFANVDEECSFQDCFNFLKKVQPNIQQKNLSNRIEIRGLQLRKLTSKTGQIYYIDLTWLKKTDWQIQKKMKQLQIAEKAALRQNYTQNILLLSFFDTILKKQYENVASYLCIGYRRQQPHPLLRYFQIIQPHNFGKLFIDSRNEQTTDLRSIYFNGNNLDQIVRLQSMIQQQTHGLSKILEMGYLKQQQRNDIKGSLQNMGTSIDKHIVQALRPIKRICDGIHNDGNIDRNIFQNISLYQSISDSVCKKFECRSSIQKSSLKSDKFEHINFLSDFITKFDQFQGSRQQQGIEFIKKSLQLMRSTYIYDKQKINQLLEQVEALQKKHKLINSIVNMSTDQFLRNHIIDICREWIPSKYKILKYILKFRVDDNHQKIVYQLLQKILNKQYNQNEFPSKQDYHRTQAKIHTYKFLVQCQKQLALMKKQVYKDNRKVSQSIKQLIPKLNSLQDTSYLEQYKINAHQILKKCAYYAHEVGSPQLAIQIYKYLQHPHKIEECMQDLIFSKKDREIVEMYCDFSQYFKNVGNKALCIKYAQLAYQQDSFKLQFLNQAKKATTPQISNQISEPFELPQSITAQLLKLDDRVTNDKLQSKIKSSKIAKIFKRAGSSE